MTQSSHVNKGHLALGGAILSAVLVWMVWAAWVTGTVISDSWQSVGPAVMAEMPFKLHGLFLGNFDGFDRVWGHHWPGWAMAISLTRPWLPFHPLVVFSIEVALVALVAWVPFRVALQSGRRWLALVVLLIALLQPEINVALSMMRPEALTSVLMVILAEGFATSDRRRSGVAMVLTGSFFLPLVHVLGVIAPPAMIAAWMVWGRFSPRTLIADARFKRAVALMIGWLSGVGALAFWFISDESRLHQFRANLAAQRLSYHSLIHCARACYLSEPAGPLLLALWVVLGCSAVAALRKNRRNLEVILWAAMPLASIAFSMLAQNPNRLHLAAVVPCSLVACVIGRRVESTRLSHWTLCLLVPVAVFAMAFQVNRMVKCLAAQSSGSRQAARELVDRFAGKGRLYLPLSLWEAAAAAGEKNARFYTFPNVAEPSYREEAERSLFKDAHPGDLLIFDVTQNEAKNDYFEKSAFVHLIHVNPFALGPEIEEIRISGLSDSRLYKVIRIERPPFQP